MQAFGGYDQIITYVNFFDLAVYATNYGIPFWAGMFFTWVWFLPAFNANTGFRGTGGEGFGILLAYCIIGGGDYVASYIF